MISHAQSKEANKRSDKDECFLKHLGSLALTYDELPNKCQGVTYGGEKVAMREKLMMCYVCLIKRINLLKCILKLTFLNPLFSSVNHSMYPYMDVAVLPKNV